MILSYDANPGRMEFSERTGTKMTEHSKIADEFQKVGKEGFEAAVRSYGDANKGFQPLSPRSRIIRKRRLRTALALLSSSSAQSLSSTQSKFSLSTSINPTMPTLPR